MESEAEKKREIEEESRRIQAELGAFRQEERKRKRGVGCIVGMFAIVVILAVAVYYGFFDKFFAP